MAASARPPKGCNDNNDTNPNSNWKSNVGTFLAIGCQIGAEYLIAYMCPEQEALAIGLNIASSSASLISSLFRRKSAVKVLIENDAEKGLAETATAMKTVAQATSKRVVIQTAVPALAGTFVASFGPDLLQQTAYGNRLITAYGALAQLWEAGSWWLRDRSGVPAITDNHMTDSADTSYLGTPPQRRDTTSSGVSLQPKRG